MACNEHSVQPLQVLRRMISLEAWMMCTEFFHLARNEKN